MIVSILDMLDSWEKDIVQNFLLYCFLKCVTLSPVLSAIQGFQPIWHRLERMNVQMEKVLLSMAHLVDDNIVSHLVPADVAFFRNVLSNLKRWSSDVLLVVALPTGTFHLR
ncbi:hypothetical protein PHMEG_00020965 [Phytophthora megakarya]|uniref:Uncharacterized protein n=1 Tax=Phytophthora megakarya TaxID=4795 RepID=A0A225VMG5_9STRA|nr:hypothetical protein PHMEG_00020965 [Phytophthora megakarya]